MRYSKEWHRQRKEQLVAYKGGKCLDCGGIFFACCYDFDHRIPSEKSFTISEASASGKISIEDLMKEVDKCDLVCANCHRIRTQGNKLISEKIKENQKGRKPWNRGIQNPYSSETIQKMSVSQIKRFKENSPSNKGVSESEEQRKKISKTLKEKGIHPSVEACRLGGKARQALIV
jgi:hypothetical protein